MPGRRDIPGIKKLADGRYQVDPGGPGRPRRICDSFKEAVKTLDLILHDRLPEKKENLTVAELIASSLENKQGRVCSRTHRNNQSMMAIVEREVPKFASLLVTEVDEEQIEHVLKTVTSKRDLEGSTANRYRVALSRIFTHARKKLKLIAANPVREVEPLLEKKKRERYLREHEEILLRRLIREMYPEREAEFDLALYTGIRRKEQFWLTWEEVDWDRKILTIPAAISKSPKDHSVPLNSGGLAALRALERRSNGCPRITRDEDTDEGYEHALDWWSGNGKKVIGVLEVSKIPNLHWHDLRHTFGTRCAMENVPMPVLMEWMGHGSIVTTMRYAHFAPKNQHEQIERIMRYGAPTNDNGNDKKSSNILQMIENKGKEKAG